MDSKGVMGMPIRLSVAFLIIALCIPILYGAVEDFEDETDVASAESEAKRIVDAATSVHYQRLGASAVVDISLVSGCEMVIDPSADAGGIRIMRNGELKDTVYCQRPPLMFVGEPLIITGPMTLRVTSVGSEEVEVRPA